MEHNPGRGVAFCKQYANNRMTHYSGGLRTVQQQHKDKWTRPNMGVFKVNVDAAVKQNQNHYAVGMVLRNHEGKYISGMKVRIEESVQVVEAEVRAIFDALKWLEELSMAEVIIESDSLLGVKALTQSYTNYMELGTLVQQCRI